MRSCSSPRVRADRWRSQTCSARARRSDWADIRTWAQTQGPQVPERGRICASVVRRYEVARGKASNGQLKPVARTRQPHVIRQSCPLTCLERQLPGRTYKALSWHLEEQEYFVHPLVEDVAGLYRGCDEAVDKPFCRVRHGAGAPAPGRDSASSPCAAGGPACQAGWWHRLGAAARASPLDGPGRRGRISGGLQRAQPAPLPPARVPRPGTAYRPAGRAEPDPYVA